MIKINSLNYVTENGSELDLKGFLITSISQIQILT